MATKTPMKTEKPQIDSLQPSSTDYAAGAALAQMFAYFDPLEAPAVTPAG